jgi:hypothetical protein
MNSSDRSIWVEGRSRAADEILGARKVATELLGAAALMDRQPRKDTTMSDLKLGEPIPAGIPGIQPDSSTEVQDAAAAVVQPFQETVGVNVAAYPDSALFDQLLLFPMKLGLSMALASTAMLVSPLLMAKRLETTGLTQ